MGFEKMKNSMEIEEENNEKTKISLMRILVEKQDPSSKVSESLFFFSIVVFPVISAGFSILVFWLLAVVVSLSVYVFGCFSSLKLGLQFQRPTIFLPSGDKRKGLSLTNKNSFPRFRLSSLVWVVHEIGVLQEVEDWTLRRFLRARDLDVEKASNMFLKYLNWKRNFVPNGSISPSEIRHEIQQNKMFLQGWDKKGRPIALLLAARHFQHEGGVDEFKRTYFTFQTSTKCLGRRWLWIFPLQVL